MLKKILVSLSLLISFNCHTHEPSNKLWCVYIAPPGRSAMGEGKLYKVYSEIYPSRYPDEDGVQRIHVFYKCDHENTGARLDCPSGWSLVILEGGNCSERI